MAQKNKIRKPIYLWRQKLIGRERMEVMLSKEERVQLDLHQKKMELDSVREWFGKLEIDYEEPISGYIRVKLNEKGLKELARIGKKASREIEFDEEYLFPPINIQGSARWQAAFFFAVFEKMINKGIIPFDEPVIVQKVPEKEKV